ncbi:MAG: ATP-dependent DNA helicase RecG [Acidobacteriota bacterium]|nr:ATP-dependent DNA helicase RecG [Blastocatellia bacterium]MDW8412410.1 ATP-dependent DNA helicase RecG [Acidobacteriota bacterium]
MTITLSTPVEELHRELPRVGVKTAKVLANAVASYCGVYEGSPKVEDLLSYLPIRYEDRSNLARVRDLGNGMEASVVLEVRVVGSYKVGRNGKHKIFELLGVDATGHVRAYWWNQEFLERVLKRGQRVILYGRWKYDYYRKSLAVENPEYELVEDDFEAGEIHTGRRVPIYRKLGEIRTKQMRSLMHRLLQQLDLSDMQELLPPELCERYGLPAKSQAIRYVHFPQDDVPIELYNAFKSPAHKRLVFEEFFLLLLALALRRADRKRNPKSAVIKVDDRIRDIIRLILPFRLTEAQKRVVEEIVADMSSPYPMNRLLQGDVGSGKTIVAAQAIAVAVENGYQAALMVPTEILAEQHAHNLSRLYEKVGYRVGLLTGSLKSREKRLLQQAIRNGEVSLTIGTHALIQEGVEFKNLALVVIDEQHRFGVLQRAELIKRGYNPDVLVMTATPIPRSLAMTVYGDLDLSVIDQLPPGRTPVYTCVRTEAARDRIYSFILSELRQGRQCYIVYPLVEESEKVDLLAATRMAEQLQKGVFREFVVGLLHGKMKQSEKEEVMQRFVANQINVLVSTTVIEVGIDVPNASVMLIEHAERFGLSQLHQLRGRVGRGAAKSYCILMASEPKSEEATERLAIMEKTTDGFEIAEKDLELRGPGELMGTRQSGEQLFRVANPIRDRELLDLARKEVDLLLKIKGASLFSLSKYLQTQPRYRLSQVG